MSVARADGCAFLMNASVGTGVVSENAFGVNVFGGLDASVPLAPYLRVGGVGWRWVADRSSDPSAERADAFTGFRPLLELASCSEDTEVTVRLATGLALGTRKTGTVWGDFLQLSGGPRFPIGNVRLGVLVGFFVIGGPPDRFPPSPFLAIELGYASP
jgi:hypothetical protein